MSFFYPRDIYKGPKEYCCTLPKNLFTSFNYHLMRKIFHLEVSLYSEYEAPKLVKVKAYKRIQNGKVVKVRPYYRRVWERQ